MVENQWNVSTRNTCNLSLADLTAEPLDRGFPCFPWQPDLLRPQFHISCALPLKPLSWPLRVVCLVYPDPLKKVLASCAIPSAHCLTLGFS